LHVIPVFVAVITQITAVVVHFFDLSLSLGMAIPPALLLSNSSRMASPYHIHMTFTSHHASLIVLAVLKAEAL
jgi:hypothetical protein